MTAPIGTVGRMIGALEVCNPSVESLCRELAEAYPDLAKARDQREAFEQRLVALREHERRVEDRIEALRRELHAALGDGR